MRSISLIKNNSTSTPISNQTTSRYCPASLGSCSKKQYVELRYAPRELFMVNLNTTNKFELKIISFVE